MSEPDQIPQVRLNNASVWEAILPRLEELVVRGRFILGPELEQFEKVAAETFGCGWCVGTSSGTSALVLALRAAMPPGARVAVPANTFFATLEAVVTAGHIPIVVDNDDDYLMELDQLDDLQLDAVIPVHLYGLPVDMPVLMERARERGWFVLEDGSQAHGASIGDARVGSLGHAGAFSAYPTKNLGAWGDAGFVTGNDSEIERRLRSLRHHGQTARDEHSEIGGTDRLDNIQALVLTEKLRHLEAEVRARQQVAGWYREALGNLDLDVPGDRGSRHHVFHQFVVRVPNRDRIQQQLKQNGIGTSVHYPLPIHLQPAAVSVCEVPRTPKRAEHWASQLLSLPMFASLTQAEVCRVAEALTLALKG